MGVGLRARPSFLWRTAICACVLLGAYSSCASAYAQIESYQQIVPGPVKLELRFSGGRTQFHMGEVVPVELVFTGPEHREYSAGEDCMPRYPYNFPAHPAAFIFRAYELDAALMMDFGNCHGFSQKVDLAAVPFVVNLVLNNWFRMDTPGKYKISVTSTRLGFAVTSDPVDLEILPSDPAWEDAEVKRGLALVDAPRARGSAGWEEGCRVLRFLETKASEVEMARHEAGPARCSSFDAPLVSVKNRNPVLAELVKGLTDPALGIEGNYLRTTAFLSLYNQHPNWYPAQELEADPNKLNETSVLWSRPGVPEMEEIRYARTLDAALPMKAPEARKTSLETLIYVGVNPGSKMQIPQDLLDSIVSQTAAMLSSLSPYALSDVLVNEWDEFNVPAMATALADLAGKGDSLGPDGIVLRRLYELSPDKGRPIILSLLKGDSLTLFRNGEITHPQFYVDTLGMLPEKELPELDDVLWQHLQNSRPTYPTEVAAGLIQRYASAAIEDRVRPWFEGNIGKIPCDAQASLTAYFLRVDPPAGTALLTKAIQASDPACRPLQHMAAVRMLPDLERAALAALEDPKPSVVVDALGTLQGWGSASTREPILEHFRKWHAAWANRQLAAPLGKDQTDVESAYIYALGSAQAWYTSEQDWRVITTLCVSDGCGRTVQGVEMSWNFPVGVSMVEIGMPALPGFLGTQGFPYSVSPGNPGPQTLERLKEKMAEYPRGYEFRIDDRNREMHVIQKLYDELLPLAKDHGFKLFLLNER